MTTAERERLRALAQNMGAAASLYANSEDPERLMVDSPKDVAEVCSGMLSLLADVDALTAQLDLVLKSPDEHLRAAADLATRLGHAEAQLAALREAVTEWKRIASVFDPKALSKAPLEAEGVTRTPRVDGRWFVVQNAVETLAYTKYPGMALVLRDMSRLILSSHAALLDSPKEG